MKLFKPEKRAELLFSFPDDLVWEEFDAENFKRPQGMCLVDLVIELDEEILLVEIKDPSNSKSPEKERNKYFKRLTDNSILSEELTPKVRDSYTYLHLMARDTKPFKYYVLLGLDAFDPKAQSALLINFKDRLLADIRCESYEPWKRQHIQDCAVVTVEVWNKRFPDWPITRVPTATAEGA